MMHLLMEVDLSRHTLREFCRTSLRLRGCDWYRQVLTPHVGSTLDVGSIPAGSISNTHSNSFERTRCKS